MSDVDHNDSHGSVDLSEYDYDDAGQVEDVCLAYNDISNPLNPEQTPNNEFTQIPNRHHLRTNKDAIRDLIWTCHQFKLPLDVQEQLITIDDDVHYPMMIKILRGIENVYQQEYLPTIRALDMEVEVFAESINLDNSVYNSDSLPSNAAILTERHAPLNSSVSCQYQGQTKSSNISSNNTYRASVSTMEKEVLVCRIQECQRQHSDEQWRQMREHLQMTENEDDEENENSTDSKLYTLLCNHESFFIKGLNFVLSRITYYRLGWSLFEHIVRDVLMPMVTESLLIERAPAVWVAVEKLFRTILKKRRCNVIAPFTLPWRPFYSLLAHGMSIDRRGDVFSWCSATFNNFAAPLINNLFESTSNFFESDAMSEIWEEVVAPFLYGPQSEGFIALFVSLLPVHHMCSTKENIALSTQILEFLLDKCHRGSTAYYRGFVFQTCDFIYKLSSGHNIGKIDFTQYAEPLFTLQLRILGLQGDSIAACSRTLYPASFSWGEGCHFSAIFSPSASVKMSDACILVDAISYMLPTSCFSTPEEESNYAVDITENGKKHVDRETLCSFNCKSQVSKCFKNNALWNHLRRILRLCESYTGAQSPRTQQTKNSFSFVSRLVRRFVQRLKAQREGLYSPIPPSHIIGKESIDEFISLTEGPIMREMYRNSSMGKVSLLCELSIKTMLPKMKALIDKGTEGDTAQTTFPMIAVSSMSILAHIGAALDVNEEDDLTLKCDILSILQEKKSWTLSMIEEIGSGAESGLARSLVCYFKYMCLFVPFGVIYSGNEVNRAICNGGDEVSGNGDVDIYSDREQQYLQHDSDLQLKKATILNCDASRMIQSFPILLEDITVIRDAAFSDCPLTGLGEAAAVVRLIKALIRRMRDSTAAVSEVCLLEQTLVILFTTLQPESQRLVADIILHQISHQEKFQRRGEEIFFTSICIVIPEYVLTMYASIARVHLLDPLSHPDNIEMHVRLLKSGLECLNCEDDILYKMIGEEMKRDDSLTDPMGIVNDMKWMKNVTDTKFGDNVANIIPIVVRELLKKVTCSLYVTYAGSLVQAVVVSLWKPRPLRMKLRFSQTPTKFTETDSENRCDTPGGERHYKINQVDLHQQKPCCSYFYKLVLPKDSFVDIAYPTRLSRLACAAFVSKLISTEVLALLDLVDVLNDQEGSSENRKKLSESGPSEQCPSFVVRKHDVEGNTAYNCYNNDTEDVISEVYAEQGTSKDEILPHNNTGMHKTLNALATVGSHIYKDEKHPTTQLRFTDNNLAILTKMLTARRKTLLPNDGSANSSTAPVFSSDSNNFSSNSLNKDITKLSCTTSIVTSALFPVPLCQSLEKPYTPANIRRSICNVVNSIYVFPAAVMMSAYYCTALENDWRGGVAIGIPHMMNVSEGHKGVVSPPIATLVEMVESFNSSLPSTDVTVSPLDIAINYLLSLPLECNYVYRPRSGALFKRELVPNELHAYFSSDRCGKNMNAEEPNDTSMTQHEKDIHITSVVSATINDVYKEADEGIFSPSRLLHILLDLHKVCDATDDAKGLRTTLRSFKTLLRYNYNVSSPKQNYKSSIISYSYCINRERAVPFYYFEARQTLMSVSGGVCPSLFFSQTSSTQTTSTPQHQVYISRSSQMFPSPSHNDNNSATTSPTSSLQQEKSPLISVLDFVKKVVAPMVLSQHVEHTVLARSLLKQMCILYPTRFTFDFHDVVRGTFKAMLGSRKDVSKCNPGQRLVHHYLQVLQMVNKIPHGRSYTVHRRNEKLALYLDAAAPISECLPVTLPVLQGIKEQMWVRLMRSICAMYPPSPSTVRRRREAVLDALSPEGMSKMYNTPSRVKWLLQMWVDCFRPNLLYTLPCGTQDQEAVLPLLLKYLEHVSFAPFIYSCINTSLERCFTTRPINEVVVSSEDRLNKMNWVYYLQDFDSITICGLHGPPKYYRLFVRKPLIVFSPNEVEEENCRECSNTRIVHCNCLQTQQNTKEVWSLDPITFPNTEGQWTQFIVAAGTRARVGDIGKNMLATMAGYILRLSNGSLTPCLLEGAQILINNWLNDSCNEATTNTDGASMLFSIPMNILRTLHLLNASKNRVTRHVYKKAKNLLNTHDDNTSTSNIPLSHSIPVEEWDTELHTHTRSTMGMLKRNIKEVICRTSLPKETFHACLPPVYTIMNSVLMLELAEYTFRLLQEIVMVDVGNHSTHPNDSVHLDQTNVTRRRVIGGNIDDSVEMDSKDNDHASFLERTGVSPTSSVEIQRCLYFIRIFLLSISDHTAAATELCLRYLQSLRHILLQQDSLLVCKMTAQIYSPLRHYSMFDFENEAVNSVDIPLLGDGITKRSTDSRDDICETHRKTHNTTYVWADRMSTRNKMKDFILLQIQQTREVMMELGDVSKALWENGVDNVEDIENEEERTRLAEITPSNKSLSSTTTTIAETSPPSSPERQRLVRSAINYIVITGRFIALTPVEAIDDIIVPYIIDWTLECQRWLPLQDTRAMETILAVGRVISVGFIPKETCHRLIDRLVDHLTALGDGKYLGSTVASTATREMPTMTQVQSLGDDGDYYNCSISGDNIFQPQAPVYTGTPSATTPVTFTSKALTYDVPFSSLSSKGRLTMQVTEILHKTLIFNLHRVGKYSTLLKCFKALCASLGSGGQTNKLNHNLGSKLSISALVRVSSDEQVKAMILPLLQDLNIGKKAMLLQSPTYTIGTSHSNEGNIETVTFPTNDEYTAKEDMIATALRSIKVAVHALSAVILAYPESVPPFGPRVLMALSSHCSSNYPEVRNAASYCFKTWWSTHRSRWDYEYKKMFKEHEIEILMALFKSANYFV